MRCLLKDGNGASVPRNCSLCCDASYLTSFAPEMFRDVFWEVVGSGSCLLDR